MWQSLLAYGALSRGAPADTTASFRRRGGGGGGGGGFPEAARLSWLSPDVELRLDTAPTIFKRVVELVCDERRRRSRHT